ncbi:hypothetical protein XA68_11196 [Ophiocordyceps unilateralis]|uniref:EamA domain-containing protein n=1 Tax=Ophiocordyceps unilateralis TaxID=268505 RepID=A0A2A9PHH1_OPHUN|nr:hypothetical protein XA68_11196 [Ophiocordyceps unilateralis]
MIRQRRVFANPNPSDESVMTTTTDPPPSPPPPPPLTTTTIKATRYAQWILLAVASGACAAFNGAFAKLTTTSLTSGLAHAIARRLRLSDDANRFVELAVRGTFFALNLIFNGVMWTLFTAALARGSSATQVSIVNTSTNFVLTALLGFVIFSEALPPLWWAGAALLVAGNVVVGSRDESADEHQDAPSHHGATGAPHAAAHADADERKPLLSGAARREAVLAGPVDDDVPDLGQLPSDPTR